MGNRSIRCLLIHNSRKCQRHGLCTLLDSFLLDRDIQALVDAVSEGNAPPTASMVSNYVKYGGIAYICRWNGCTLAAGANDDQR